MDSFSSSSTDFSSGSLFDSSSSLFDDSCGGFSTMTDINPASGLPMVGGTGGVDVAGNPYGCSESFF